MSSTRTMSSPRVAPAFCVGSFRSCARTKRFDWHPPRRRTGNPEKRISTMATMMVVAIAAIAATAAMAAMAVTLVTLVTQVTAVVAMAAATLVVAMVATTLVAATEVVVMRCR